MRPEKCILLIDDESQNNDLENIQRNLISEIDVSFSQIEVLNSEHIDNNANFDIFDVDLNTIDFEVSDGEVTVIDHIIGDVNGDGVVNPLDRVVLSRHLATWLGYEEINFRGADVNLDGKVNTLDRAILSRYLANWADYESLPYTR